MNSEQSTVKGWGLPTAARKWHYFAGGRSLCGKWGWYAHNTDKLDDTNHDSPENCAACKRRRAEHQPQAA